MESDELKTGFPLPGFRLWLPASASRLPDLGFGFAYFGSQENFVSREAATHCRPRRKPWVAHRK
jgi:hypothetical protein